MNRNLKIGIIGLGLIGGSIFKALCALKCNVFGVAHSSNTEKKALKYSKNVSLSLSSIKDCDVIFVCTPMNKTLQILDDLEPIISAKTIVTDVCSLKEFVTNKKYNYVFIPSHPMAGTEYKGFDASFENLFRGAKWILTPFSSTNSEEIKVLSSIIEVLGAKVVYSTPMEHDRAVALISHMPMLVSQALLKAASGNKLALELASSGFRDMTRLALSNEEMACDMVNMNSENIQKAILKVYSAIGDLTNFNYFAQINEIKALREKMYDEQGKNIF